MPVGMDQVYKFAISPRQKGLEGATFRFMPDMGQVKSAVEVRSAAGLLPRAVFTHPGRHQHSSCLSWQCLNQPYPPTAAGASSSFSFADFKCLVVLCSCTVMQEWTWIALWESLSSR